MSIKGTRVIVVKQAFVRTFDSIKRSIEDQRVIRRYLFVLCFRISNTIQRDFLLVLLVITLTG